MNICPKFCCFNGYTRVFKYILYEEVYSPPPKIPIFFFFGIDDYNGPSLLKYENKEQSKWDPIHFVQREDFNEIGEIFTRTMLSIQLVLHWAIWNDQGQTISNKICFPP